MFKIVWNDCKSFFYEKSDKFEMIFSSRRFFQKTNKQIRLYLLIVDLFSFVFLEDIEDTKKTS